MDYNAAMPAQLRQRRHRAWTFGLLGVVGASTWSPWTAADGSERPEAHAAESPSQTEPVPVGETTSNQELADRAFAEGLEHVQQKRFAQAKQSFLKAYWLSPHPLVAYNAALTCLEVGEHDQARALLTLALTSHGAQASASERRLLQETLESMDDLRPDTTDAAVSRDGAAPPAQDDAAHGSSAPRPSGPEVNGNDARAALQLLPHDEGKTDDASLPAAHRADLTRPANNNTAAYVWGASGLLLLSVSGAVYLWNDDRHAAWKAEDEQLAALRSRLLEQSRIPSQDPDLRGRASANDALLESIQFVDVVDGALAVAGLVGLGVGVYLALGDAPEELEIGVGRELRLRWSF